MAVKVDATVADLRRTIAELRNELGERDAELREALDQQTATAEVLQVINSSPGDLMPVFEALLETGARLCRAEQAVITLRNPQDGLYHYGASFGYSAEFKELLVGAPVAPGRASLIGRTALEGQVVHIEDAAVDPDYKWGEALRLGRWHTGLGVPLLRDGSVVGILALTRRRVERFTDPQIELIKTFADQAVVAIENARLLGELRDSNERYGLVNQAVAEGIYDWDIARDTLWVSPRLIELFGWEKDSGRGDGDRPSHDWNTRVHPDEFESYRSALRANLKGETARMQCEYRIRLSSGEYRWVEDHALPVRNERGRAVRLVGAVSDVTDRKGREQELREALDQQTATTEVLEVINASPGDLGPVFDAMLEKAMRLCTAAFGYLLKYDGERFQTVAHHGLPPLFAEYLRRMDQPGPTGAYARILGGAPLVHVTDLTDGDVYRTSSLRRALVDLGGARTGLIVALRTEGRLLGIFTIYRQEVRPFSDKQIALLQNFAAQAVIAMENARLIAETREALEQQTATAEVLTVISNSLTDTQPVFDAIVQSGLKLFPDAAVSVALAVEDQVHAVAVAEPDPARAEAWRRRFPFPLTREYMHSAAILDQQVINIPDVRDAPPEFAAGSRNFLASGYRGITIVPMRRGDASIGVLSVVRPAPGPLSAEQLAVLKTFANQAVIAIENARLLTETREALDQQTATAEVLQVINSSPGDLAPVFEAMLEKAIHLCEGIQGTLWTFAGERPHLAASQGLSAEFVETLRARREHEDPGDHDPVRRIMHGERLVQILNVGTDRRHGRVIDAAAELGGVGTIIFVALVKDTTHLGAFAISRSEVQPFTDKQIALLQSFAAQAVIAMENARLLDETRRRTADLQESLEYQTATSDVLNVISRSAFDLQPILETVVATAARLCQAEKAILYRYENGAYRFAAGHSNEPEYERIERATPIYPGEGTVAGRAALHKRAVQIVDPLADPLYESKDEAQIGLARSMIGVPLLRDGLPIGVIALARERVEPFTDRQIELVQTFADQAVIAIENARLITETREALDQQTATSEVLQVINGSPGDLTPVFDAVLEKALHLCGAAFGDLYTYDGERFRVVALRGASAEYIEHRIKNPPNPSVPGTVSARLLVTKQPLQVLDLKAEEVYGSALASRRVLVDVGGARTQLAVPLLKGRRGVREKTN